MKYLIMITIVIGIAAADFVTGWIKAYIGKCYFTDGYWAIKDE